MVSKKTISLAKGHINIEDIVATSLDNGGYHDKVFETKIGMCGSSFFAGIGILYPINIMRHDKLPKDGLLYLYKIIMGQLKVQWKMSGKYKITIILLFIICSCKNELKTNNKNGLNTNRERVFITQNINSLIDSVESFDTSLIPPSKEFKDLKVEKITIGLLDSVFIENDESFNFINQKKSFKFKLQESDLVNFKTNYTIKLVKVNNYDNNILFVNFSNFYMTDNEANIDVKKNIGISIIKERYYFIKRNAIWVFKKKELLGMGW